MNIGAFVTRKLERDLRRGMEFFLGCFMECSSGFAYRCCEDSLGLSRAPGGVDKDFFVWV